MTIEIVQLTDRHLEDAAALFVQHYRQARELDPHLAPDHENGSTLLPRLAQMVRSAPGVAALQRGRLAGFLATYLLDDLRGEQAVYSPEWANAANMGNARQVYQAMYATLAAQWVRDGYLAHYATVLAHDTLALETLHWLGFGMTGVDAVRDLAPIEAGDAGVDIREATRDEIQDIVGLNQELVQYSASAPIFLPQPQSDAHYYQEWLADSAHRLWLAYRDDEAVGYIKLQKWNPEVCVVTQDDRSVSIVGAFIKERFRGAGVGTALLSHVLSWARSMKFERCAVDFEPQNALGAAFWLRHFRPVCYSVVRHVYQLMRGAGPSDE